MSENNTEDTPVEHYRIVRGAREISVSVRGDLIIDTRRVTDMGLSGVPLTEFMASLNTACDGFEDVTVEISHTDDHDSCYYEVEVFGWRKMTDQEREQVEQWRAGRIPDRLRQVRERARQLAIVTGSPSRFR